MSALPIRSIPDYPSPSPADIKRAIKASKATEREIALALYVPTIYITNCKRGKTAMHPALAELMAIKFQLGIYKDCRYTVDK